MANGYNHKNTKKRNFNLSAKSEIGTGIEIRWLLVKRFQKRVRRLGFRFMDLLVWLLSL